MTTSSMLTPEQRQSLGEELDAIRQSVIDDLGTADTDYISKVIRAQQLLEITGRGLFYLGWFPPAWVGGATALGLSKILDNMEIGHNVMHGQYDWTNDPNLSSSTFEWDTSAVASHWKHSHNHIHHTNTNILGVDRDIGYGMLRVSDDQEWQPQHLANPVVAIILASLFQYGVMLHELEIERLISRENKWADSKQIRKEMGAKLLKQTRKDYLLYPALTGPLFLSTLAGNATANLMRNLWSFSIIFCGHFPDGVAVFDPEDLATESRGAWYERQLMGSANIDGGPLFHLMSGNLSFQIEHHLFPDLPAHRYADIAPQVREICERYGLPYNSGGLTKQLSTVARKIVRLALPSRKRSNSEAPATPKPLRSVAA